MANQSYRIYNFKSSRAFAEGDGMSCIEVYSSDVVVTINTGNHDHGSSKVKLKNLVDYNWEPKFYPGQLLAIHISGKYLAYSIKGNCFDHVCSPVKLSFKITRY